jgi:hypothetical protein
MKWIFRCLAVLALGMSLQAETVGRREMRNGVMHLILENELAQVVVCPSAGAAIVEYIDKRSGVDFAAKPGENETAGYGWRDTTAYDFYGWNRIGSLPYGAELIKGKGRGAIRAVCTSDWLLVEREMALADDGTTLTVTVRHTNVSDTPHTLWLRFQPFMALDDRAMVSSAILVPGPEPRTLRRVNTGSPQDANFIDVPGYWMAVNASNDVGLWMTFDTNDATLDSTWTGDKGRFTAEVRPHPRIVAPGESVMLHAAYQPFSAGDKDAQLGMELIPETARGPAQRFLALARPNLAVLASYTMGKSLDWKQSLLETNRFTFSIFRRDRFALLDWGIVDAMMAVPGDQSISIRTRLYAQAFDAQARPFAVSYRLTITDALGKVVKQQRWQSEGGGAVRLIDRQENVSIEDLPDGRYTFLLEAFDGTEVTRPVHQYVETRKLAGATRAAACAARVKAEQGVPLEQRERPFVTALRTMAVPAVDSGVAPIGVEEAAGLARAGWPVRVGVPFAQGVLKMGAPAALSDPGGKAVPVQTTVMGTWPDGSVKWLLADFQATVPANSHVFYTLKANARPAAAPAADLAAQQEGSIRVDTGVRQWAFAAGDAKLLGLFGADDVWWRTADGRNYRFALRGEEAGISVVENGPLRAVVKVVGWYVPVPPAAGEPIARGEFRAEFCRGQAWFRLYHTFTFAGDPWRDGLASTGVRFSGLLANATEAGIDMDGQTVFRPGKLTLWQADDDHAVIESGAAPVHAGRRSTGAAVLRSPAGGAVVYHRNLWELFPKTVEVEAGGGAIAFDYWPRRAGALDWRPYEDAWMQSSSSPHALGAGVSRTHEFIVDRGGALDPAQYQAVFDEPVLAVVPPRYLCATKALFHLQPYDPDKAPELESLLSEGLGSWILNREVYGWNGQWDYGTLHNWYVPELGRWADYGRYANLMNEQDILHLPWLAYLRSGDRAYFKLAEANTRHLMEVGTIRLSPLYPDDAGMSRRHHACVWLGQADFGHSMLDPFLELYHATGYRPAFEAAERMARAMAKNRRVDIPLTGRYLSNPVTGLARMYLETQDPFYKREADYLWEAYCAPDRGDWYMYDHGSRMAIVYSQINEDCKRLWREMADPESEWNNAHPRGKGPPLQDFDSLAMLYQQTDDKRIAQRALKSFSGYWARLQENDFSRSDPARWSFTLQPQMILSMLRPLVYSSAMLDDALSEERDWAGNQGSLQPIPATWADSPLRCVVREDRDQEIQVQLRGTVGQTNALVVQAFGPDGALISCTTVPHGRHAPFVITLPRDGQTGQYVLFVKRPLQGDDISLPLTKLPEVFLIGRWAAYSDRYGTQPARYYTRSPGDEPLDMSISGDRTMLMAADQRTLLGYTDKTKKAETVRIGPEGAWLCAWGAAGSHYAADGLPVIVSTSPARWFWPDAKSLACTPEP